MRGNPHPVVVLLGAGILLYLGRHLFRESELVTWGLTFGGTTAAGLLLLMLRWLVPMTPKQGSRA